MKRFIFALLVALTLLTPAPARHAFAAPGSEAAGPALNVLAVETFLADIAQNVAGDRQKVAVLLPAGADPHSFEPTPADAAKIAASNLLIINGAGFENFLDRLLQNAGGARKIVEASAGLTGRALREGETAELSDADFADVLCDAAGKGRVQKLRAGRDAGSAAPVPAESGFFELLLIKQDDGTYGGYLKYAADEKGDFQIAGGKGRLQIFAAANTAPLDVERTMPLDCGGLVQGSIVELEKNQGYLIALTGFKAEKGRFLIRPLTGRHHHEGDPHFWLAPNNVIQYVKNIRRALSDADPEGAAAYAANADLYIAQLEDLDRWIADQVGQVPPDHRLLVTNHESLGYFADRYGFKVTGTVIPSVSTGASPSARQLARLIDGIKATGTKAILLETGANPQLAKQVARETGIKVVTELYTHSITGPKGPAPSYIEMMKYNTLAIVNALK
ncbi:MAG: metal ABC transporter substrate-binding protein [Syntrophobacteraceae bacterium]